jgi:hypothetical protein
MKKIFFGCLISLFLFVTVANGVLAQTESSQLESCFAYYDYGKIQTNLATEKNSYSRGEIVKIRGTIINNNNFPLVNLVLYAHLKRVNNTTSFNQNGHYLVDRLTLLENLNFLPGETKAINVNFPIPPTYPNGKYQLHYFLFSKNGFHYGGRPFLEEDTAGYSSFEVINNQEPTAYFDIGSLKVNNISHNIREQIYEYNQEPLTFNVVLINQTSSDTPVFISIYSFEDTFETGKIASEQKTIKAGSSNIKYDFIPKDPGAYVVLFQTNSPLRSILKYRFAVSGNQSTELRMNDLGISNYPADKNKDRAYVCFHSPTPQNTPDTKVTLSILDSGKKLLDQKIIQQQFSGDVLAISLPFLKLTDLTDFWIKAEFIQPANPKKSQTVEIYYDKNTFKESISSLNIAYDNGNLNLQPANVLGNSVNQGYIESIRVKNADGKVVQEAYNLISAPKQFSLNKLSVGSYTAEVKSGLIKKEISFNVPSITPPSPKKQSNFFIYIIIVVIVVIIGVSIYVFWQRKKQPLKLIFIALTIGFFFLSAKNVSAEVVVFRIGNDCYPTSLTENIATSQNGQPGSNCDFNIEVRPKGEWVSAGNYFDSPPMLGSTIVFTPVVNLVPHLHVVTPPLPLINLLFPVLSNLPAKKICQPMLLMGREKDIIFPLLRQHPLELRLTWFYLLKQIAK